MHPQEGSTTTTVHFNSLLFHKSLNFPDDFLIKWNIYFEFYIVFYAIKPPQKIIYNLILPLIILINIWNIKRDMNPMDQCAAPRFTNLEVILKTH